MTLFTRDNVKTIVNSAVGLCAARYVKNTITDHTEMDDDGIPVQILSMSSGMMVANVTHSRTDQLVDFVAEKIAVRKKDQKTEEEK